MDKEKQTFWRSYLSGLQLSVAVAAYTKVPRTWRDDDYVPDINKLYFIEDGEGYVAVGEDRRYPKPGSLCLLPAERRQSYGTVGEHTFSKYWCHFTAKLGGMHLFHALEAPVVIQVDDPARLKALFDRLLAAHKSPDWTAGMLEQAALLEILAAFLEQSRPAAGASPESAIQKMTTVLAYIDAHLADNLTVEELASLLHFHPNYFSRVFKRTTGLSPIQYVNRKRMDKARHQLAFTGISVSNIAFSLGMEPTYFSRMFKEHTGLAPSEYRESFA
ncbi:helix-turn-helix domain-containing protein [Paenibacillus methanolicus]|uniref:AraC-like protein n=1 Tax=Paenibacillus methanolicus TaxID=582686 RepID=A0A5S5CIU6_9BACL|nr:AraC family transcriptional regulator [Paenibacillus methanolicus]TYP78126.1 AraC-like protein [Paenibacillus methanolicus]